MIISDLKNRLINEISEKTYKYYLFDYDGTLIKHQDDYNAMYLDKNIINILENINKIKNVRIGIVTGRSLSDIKKMVPVDNMIYVTNHGYLIERNGKIIKEHRDFNKETYIKKYNDIIEELKEYKGITLKIKESCAFIRFKTLPEELKNDFKEKALKIIHKKFKDEEVRIRVAHNIIEFLPIEITNKGEGIEYVIDQTDSLVFFAGDDIADEDGFNYVNSINGISARLINQASTIETSAQFKLTGVEEVEELLKFILSEEERNFIAKDSDC